MMKRSFNALIWLMVFSLLIPLALAESTATPAPESTTAVARPGHCHAGPAGGRPDRGGSAAHCTRIA
jgi:hypothetical protein